MAMAAQKDYKEHKVIAIIGDWECEVFQQNKAQLLLRQDAFVAHTSKDGFKECRKSELSLNGTNHYPFNKVFLNKRINC